MTWFGKYWEGANAKAASAETISPVASNVVKTDQGYVITVTVAPDVAAKLASTEGGTLTVATAAAD